MKIFTSNSINGRRKIINRIALVILFVVFILPGFSQTVITGGTTLKVLSGTSVTSTEQMTVQNTGSLINDGTVILKKNLDNQNATANSLGSGTFIMSGTSGQSILGQSIFQNLTISNSTGVTIGGSTRVNGSFSLTSGIVTLGSNNLLLGANSTVAGTPSSSNMVAATGSGQLRKEFPVGALSTSTLSFTYPVGDATSAPEYSPVTLNFISGSFAANNYAGITLVNAQYPGTSVNYLNRYWNISQSNITNFSCAATFQYVPADVVGDESNMYCFKVEPAPFIAYQKANTGTHTLVAPGLTTFSSFTGNRGSTLTPPETHIVGGVNVEPAQTLCFDAQKTLIIAGNGTTFIVQSSGLVNLVAGEKILLYPGTLVYSGGTLHGYITSTGTYCSVPSNPIVVNQEEKASTTTGLEILKDGYIRIYPNPTQGEFTVELSKNLVGVPIQTEIFGVRGEKVFSKDLTGELKHEFTLAGRPVGVYFVKVIAGDEVLTHKLILTR